VISQKKTTRRRGGGGKARQPRGRARPTKETSGQKHVGKGEKKKAASSVRPKGRAKRGRR